MIARHFVSRVGVSRVGVSRVGVSRVGVSRVGVSRVNDAWDKIALYDGSDSITFGDLRARVVSAVIRLQHLAGKRVGYAGTRPLAHLTISLAADWLGMHLFFAGNRSPAEMESLNRQFDWDAVLSETDLSADDLAQSSITSLPDLQEGIVTVLTSGTTGVPKAANHSWKTLSSPARVSRKFENTAWFCAYPVHLYAGLQVMIQAFLNQATFVVPPSREPAVVARVMNQGKVTNASGTPTFWRQLFLFGTPAELHNVPLQQITMGGEIATQDLLDRIQAVFPGLPVAHIYASTELGRIFVVRDGLEGFPASYLENPPEPGTELKIVDGELFVRSRNRMIGYDNLELPELNGWMETGDLVEVSGSRVRFLGRKNELINVGGNKVSPIQVEEKLRHTQGVADLRVYARRSSLVGQIVAMDLVLADGFDESVVRGNLKRTISTVLRQHEKPATVKVVSEISNTHACKTIRKAG